jgi:hypothetical protein
MKLYFGLPEEYIFKNVAKIEESYTLAKEKGKVDETAEIVELTSDEAWGKVEYSDGTTKWIELT